MRAKPGPVIFADKLPVQVKNFAVLRNFVPVNSSGNCRRYGCGTAVSCRKVSAWNPKIAKFPVKFPVRREYTRRSVRFPLRRQPASVGFGEYYRFDRKRPANGGVLKMGPVSSCSGAEFLGLRLSRISKHFQENSRFRETVFGDSVRSPLRGLDQISRGQDSVSSEPGAAQPVSLWRSSLLCVPKT